MKKYIKETEARLWYHNLNPNGKTHIQTEYSIVHGYDRSKWEGFLIEKKIEFDNREI